jgi:hypothetical protein
MDKSEIQTWEMFRGKANSAGVLDERADLITKLILQSADCGVTVAQMFRDQVPEITLNEEQFHRSRLESVGFALSVIDEMASRYSAPAIREELLDRIEENLSAQFADDLFLPDQFYAFIQIRGLRRVPQMGEPRRRIRRLHFVLGVL